MLRAGLLGIATLLVTTSLMQAQTPVERGSYLVNGLLTCGNCHTPRGPGGVFAMDQQLSGGPQEWDRPTYKVRGSNITPAGNRHRQLERCLPEARHYQLHAAGWRTSCPSCPMASTRSSPRAR